LGPRCRNGAFLTRGCKVRGAGFRGGKFKKKQKLGRKMKSDGFQSRKKEDCAIAEASSQSVEGMGVLGKGVR